MGNTIKSGNFGEYELNIFVEKIIFVNEQIPEAGREGTVLCNCGGKVHYVRNYYNNHLWWNCNKCGFVLVSDDLTSYKMEW